MDDQPPVKVGRPGGDALDLDHGGASHAGIEGAHPGEALHEDDVFIGGAWSLWQAHMVHEETALGCILHGRYVQANQDEIIKGKQQTIKDRRSKNR